MKQIERKPVKPRRPIGWVDRILALLVIGTGLAIAAGVFVLWPVYINPHSRMYSSALGFLKVQRLLGLNLKVEAEHPVYHDFVTPILGEGLVQCDFYNVPVIPAAAVKTLCVEEGDEVKKGQVLAILDDTQAQVKYRMAEVALSSAKAELLRVNAGSVNTMQAERPAKDQVDLAGMEKVVKSAQAKVQMYKQMEKDGASSKLELVNAEIELANDETNLEQAKVSARMSTEGTPGSEEIAQNAIDDAKSLLKARADELNYYKIVAPVDGIVDRVLIRNGEFNQTVGNTGFILTSSSWFEANLDQQALADVKEGMSATVNFESYPGRSFSGTIERIIPIVTFDAGGPETKTPVRPLGTGTPEWPATFRVRLRIDSADAKLAPGMTGFARVIGHTDKALAVRRVAVSSLSAGKGVVRIVDNSGHLVTTPVRIGAVDDEYVQILSGLDATDWVLKDNSRFLRDDDKINITRVVAAKE
jgi:HlyD family secretion protein